MKTEEINWLKHSSLGWYCIFCNILCDDKRISGKELMTLTICGLCLVRYKVVSNKDTTSRQKEIINNWFANRCYFCEKQQAEPFGSINGFNLCKSSCYQRYQAISEKES